MLEKEFKDQMTLFGKENELPDERGDKEGFPIEANAVALKKQGKKGQRKVAVKTRGEVQQAKGKSARSSLLPVKNKALSGLVPAGDVRLTANIREDLHLKLKIAAARRRTTIGELIEELVDKYV